MKTLTHEGLSWIDLREPSEGDLLELQQEYQFHELDIEDCLSEHERPKIDEYEDYLFLVLHIPYFDATKRRVLNEEVNIFIGTSYLITLHHGKIGAFDRLLEEMESDTQKRAEILGEGTGYFLYELISRLFDSGFPLVDDINRQIRALEFSLFEEEGGEERVLRLILELKRNIIAMRRILLPERTVVSALEHKSKRFIPDELDIYFDDVQDAVERQWGLLETAKEVIEALQDSHESWIQSRTNRIVRILTIFSVTMLPLTVLTGLYGMNVQLPYAGDTRAFLGILGVMFIILLAAVGYFGWKKWL
jgi:magnesium transporter